MVSVILPNYNYARHLHQRINSILKQSHSDFELIILDDASSDNSWDIIQQYQQKDPRIRIFRNEENSGNPFVQWQKGISLARHGLLWIAEADDHADPAFLSSMLEALQTKEIGLAFCRSVLIDNDGKSHGMWEPGSEKVERKLFEEDWEMNESELISKALIHENILANSSSVVFKKEVFEQAGGLETTLRTNADWHLWFRMAMHCQVAFVGKPMNYFRRHQESVIYNTGKDTKVYKEMFDLSMRRILRKELVQFPTELKNMLRRINEEYIQNDLGNKTIWLYRQGRFFSLIPGLISATLYPQPTLGYIRRLSKAIRLKNKDDQ